MMLGAAIVSMGLQCSRDRSSQPANFAEAAIRNERFVWDSVPGTSFTIYTQRGSYAAERAPQYRDEVDSAMSHALQMIGEAHYPAHLQVFILNSRDDVEAVMGVGYNGWSDAVGRNVGVVARAECRPVFRHEVMHAVSLLLWGQPLGAQNDPHSPSERALFEGGGWLREGLAAAAEGRYLTYSYRGMAAQWQAEGALLPLDSLMSAFYRQDDLAAYLQSGSFIQYLLEEHGNDRLRLVWRSGPSGFERVYGRTAMQLETDWQTWLRATPAAEFPRSIATARSEDICPPRRQ